jgi:hypothetical protein
VDHAGAEIFLDAFDGGRGRGPEEIRLELEAVVTIVYPDSRRSDPFPG